MIAIVLSSSTDTSGNTGQIDQVGAAAIRVGDVGQANGACKGCAGVGVKQGNLKSIVRASGGTGFNGDANWH
ncbi:MAG: hypothetical protein IPH54_21025 [Rhodoferax sp.]|nr:hypothetical protein [Rhodoferax sp.]